MPYFTTSEEWQRQSALLLQARPTTTRITTKYNIPNLSSPRYKKLLSRSAAKRAAASVTESESTPQAALVPRAQLELKTYDPESGVTLKYKTDKAAEVGRLIAGLGRLGRHMAALPEVAEDTTMTEAPSVAEQGTTPGTSTPVPAADTSKAQAGGGPAKKKKKKAGR